MDQPYYRANHPEALIDRLVFEGKVDSYPRVQVPWIDALDETEDRKKWNKIQADRDTTNSFVKASYMVDDNEETPT